MGIHAALLILYSSWEGIAKRTSSKIAEDMGFYKFVCFFMMCQIQLHPRTYLLFIFCSIPFSFANSSFLRILAIYVMLSSHLGLIIFNISNQSIESPLPPIYIYMADHKRDYIFANVLVFSNLLMEMFASYSFIYCRMSQQAESWSFVFFIWQCLR